MMKKFMLFAGLSVLALSAYGASVTYSGLVGPWEGNVAAPASGDRLYFKDNCNISISTALTYDAWITVGSASSGGVLSITNTGGYDTGAVASNMTFGVNPGGSGQLNLAGQFRTRGAIYIGQNGGTGTASITGVLSTSNTVWVGRSDGARTSTGSITMTSGILNAGGALNIAQGTAAVTGESEMTGHLNLQGGRLVAGSVTMGNATARVSNANLTVSSAMLSANVTGAFTMNTASHLTLSAAASTDWQTKGAILTVGGTMSVSSTSTIVLNLTNFDGWDGMTAGDSITLTLISYGSLNAPGGASITAVGLSEVFTLGAFNAGANAATVDITYNPIPEPALSAALLGLTGLALAIRRRRKA